MSRYSNSVRSKSTQFWFVPSECQQNLLHSNRQTWLHNHKLRSLILNSDFPIPPKLAIDIVNSWRPKCFFFVATRLQSSIKLPMEKFQLLAQLWKKRLFLGWVESEIDWKCSEISTFWLTSIFKPVLLHKVRTDFLKKDHNQKIYVCKVEFYWKTNNFNRYTRNTTL